MKKFTLFALFLLFSVATFAESPAIHAAFEKYRSHEGITNISIPGFVIHLAASIGDIEDEEREFLRCIDKVRILSIEDKYFRSKIDLHREFYSEINRDGKFEEMMTVRDHGQNVTVFGRMGENNVIKELVVLVGGDDNALIYLRGNIAPEMIARHIQCSDKNRGVHLGF
jgi:hypothetical protein